MKNLIVVILFVAFPFLIWGQERYNDLILPVKSNDTLFNCEILSVKGNTVLFNYQGELRKVMAQYILRDGVPQFLKIGYYDVLKPNKFTRDSLKLLTYNGYDYNYYHKRLRAARNMRTAGIIVSSSSLALMGGMSWEIYRYNEKHQNKNTRNDFAIMFYSGIRNIAIAGTIVGIILLIPSSIQYHMNMNALRKCTKNGVKLTCGMTENGMGLVLKF